MRWGSCLGTQSALTSCVLSFVWRSNIFSSLSLSLLYTVQILCIQSSNASMYMSTHVPTELQAAPQSIGLEATIDARIRDLEPSWLVVVERFNAPTDGLLQVARGRCLTMSHVCLTPPRSDFDATSPRSPPHNARAPRQMPSKCNIRSHDSAPHRARGC